jgi:hypothetical protein
MREMITRAYPKEIVILEIVILRPQAEESALKPCSPHRPKPGCVGLLQGEADFCKQAGLVRAERAFQHQPVRRVVAAKNGMGQFEPRP